ncbi:PTS lactose/cellobiose transporter subunit IIA [Abyssisolibacter fermentans]|uniref:PTS lactose/cellobiose transporter subunit IIA n=1 Tax=Abyssisolibacter fermentans TaxID=1766203 RepID=UPI00082B0701|nr:PTS lactose/cellobiose transporter subunit IIA [Abyssisolibacter fermentans]
MENNTNETKMTQVAMEIILHAGDARLGLSEVIKCIEANDFEGADIKLTEAKKEITIAHKAQTNLIQEEANGVKHENSLLFNHAQDTLMTISSEWNITSNLVRLFRSLKESK